MVPKIMLEGGHAWVHERPIAAAAVASSGMSGTSSAKHRQASAPLALVTGPRTSGLSEEAATVWYYAATYSSHAWDTS